jgi:hypothetical protein
MANKVRSNVGDYLNREFDRMVDIGFTQDEIELCLSDIRRGIIEALHEARCWSANNPRRSADALSQYLDKWALIPK